LRTEKTRNTDTTQYPSPCPKTDLYRHSQIDGKAEKQSYNNTTHHQTKKNALYVTILYNTLRGIMHNHAGKQTIGRGPYEQSVITTFVAVAGIK